MQKFPVFVEESLWLPRPKDKLPAWQSATQNRIHTITWHQLDFNRHLNNVEYFGLLLDVLPINILAERQLSELTIHFNAEAGLNDELSAEVMSLSDNRFLHQLRRISDDKILAVMETMWT